ncbi:MAG: hypothetical protein ABFD84_14110 [Candidatus Polarisedimenticolia bacterium]
MPIATLNDVKVRYKCDLAKTTEDAVITQSLNAALEFVARYTGIPREPEAIAELHDGACDALILGHGPIADTPALIVRESLATPRDWSDASVVSASCYVVDQRSAVVQRIDGLLFGGQRDRSMARACVRVEYTAGYAYEDAPDDLRDSVIVLTALGWKGNDYVGISGLRGDSGQITRYDYDRLPRDVRDVLDRYRLRRAR